MFIQSQPLIDKARAPSNHTSRCSNIPSHNFWIIYKIDEAKSPSNHISWCSNIPSHNFWKNYKIDEAKSPSNHTSWFSNTPSHNFWIIYNNNNKKVFWIIMWKCRHCQCVWFLTICFCSKHRQQGQVSCQLVRVFFKQSHIKYQFSLCFFG